MSEDWWRVLLVAAAIAVGGGLSVIHGVPAEMPAASLGWPLLLHLERGVALLGIAIVALLVGVRATRGRFPVRIGQLDYSFELEREDSAAIKAHERRLRAIEEALQIVPRPIRPSR